MLHHLSFAVTDLARSAAFYDAVLSPLGYGCVWADSTAVGYGVSGGEDQFAIKLRPENAAVPGDGFHVAFAAPSLEAIMQFHQAALAQNGTDNGGAGLHPEYGPDYFAAFVIDPDGYRIEAVIVGGSELIATMRSVPTKQIPTPATPPGKPSPTSVLWVGSEGEPVVLHDSMKIPDEPPRASPCRSLTAGDDASSCADRSDWTPLE